MDLIDQLAEQHIEQAIVRGELDNLPGTGTPMELDDNFFVPETLKVAYRILKNAGYVPPEVGVYTQITQIEALIGYLEPGETRTDAIKKLSLLRTKLGLARGEFLDVSSGYYQSLTEKLDRSE